MITNPALEAFRKLPFERLSEMLPCENTLVTARQCKYPTKFRLAGTPVCSSCGYNMKEALRENRKNLSDYPVGTPEYFKDLAAKAAGVRVNAAMAQEAASVATPTFKFAPGAKVVRVNGGGFRVPGRSFFMVATVHCSVTHPEDGIRVFIEEQPGTWYDEEELELHREDDVFTPRPEPDMVNSPDHYKAGGMEPWEYMQMKLTPEEFRGYLKGNIIKYLSRAELKNGAEDYRKAKWYTDKLAELYG